MLFAASGATADLDRGSRPVSPRELVEPDGPAVPFKHTRERSWAKYERGERELAFAENREIVEAMEAYESDSPRKPRE